jgi:hypothetical protein
MARHYRRVRPAVPRRDRRVHNENALAQSFFRLQRSIATLLAAHVEAGTVPNQSSIAFVLSHGSRRILIAADSLVASIDEDFGGHLEVDVATLPHHGSRRNTSPELAERIVASTWTVSTQGGGKHLFPHGEAIARMLTQKVPGNQPSFVFNSEHREAWTWNDLGTKKAYGYSTQYPDEDEGWITLSIESKPDPS